MSEEALADSESFDMESAQETLSNDLFQTEESTEETSAESVDVSTDEVTDESSDDAPVESIDDSSEELRAAPQSWKKDMHENWGSLTPEVQDYIELREQQMKEGIEIANGDTDFGRSLRDVIDPYGELLKSQGVDAPTAVKFLMNAHYNLSNADDAGKIQLINQMAESYGIKMDGTKVSPEIQNLQQEIHQLKSVVNQGQQASQQEKQTKVMEEVQAFASDPEHSYFDEVAEDIVPLVNAGHSLKDAYDKAIWANPVTRQKELDRMQKETTEKIEKDKQDKIQKANKAKSTNVRSQDTSKAPTEPLGSMEDTMRETLREIQNR